MPRFFLPTSRIHDSQAVIDGTELHHLRTVLRVKVGDTIALCDERGTEYQGTITRLSTTTGEVRLTGVTSPTPRFSLTLAQGLLKGQKMDFLVEKATELGVNRIIPFASQFTVGQVRADRQAERLARWHRIAQSAAKQSGNPIPRLDPPRSFAEFEHALPNNIPTLLFHEKEQHETLKHFAEKHPRLSALRVIIGAEGGFAEEEIAQARQAGYTLLSLGSHILRAETASVVAVTLCQFLWGNLGVPPLPER